MIPDAKIGMGRHPWRTRATLIAVLNGIITIAAALGWDPSLIEGVAVGLIDLGVTIGLIRSGEALTTPLADPRSDDGTLLVPETETRR